MLAIYEATIDRHHETVRRVEDHARHVTLSPQDRPGRPGGQRPHRLAVLLRRIAGTPATA